MVDKSIAELIPKFLQDSQNIYVTVINMEGCYEYGNQCFLSKFQLEWSQLKHTSLVQTVHPDDIDICSQATLQLIEDPCSPVKVEIRKPINQSYAWSSWEFHLLTHEDGAPRAILCLGRDLTEELRITQEVKSYKSQLKTILDSTSDGYLLISPDYKILAFNQSAFKGNKKLFGRELQVMEEIWPYVIPEAKEPFVLHSQQALQGETVFSDFQFLGHWYQFRYFPAYDEDGNIMGFSLSSTDIHEKRVLSEYRKALIQSIPDIYFILDSNGVFVDYKGSPDELYVSPEVFVGKNFKEVLPEPLAVQIQQALDTSRQSGKVVDIAYSLVVNGSTKFYEARMSTLGSEQFMVLVRDVSRRKLAELKLQEQESLLRAINDSTTESITFIDGNGKIQFSNQTAKALVKSLYNKELPEGLFYMDMVPDAMKAEVEPLLTKALNGQSVEDTKYFDKRWWSVRFFPVYDEANELIGVSNVVKDITNSKLYELQILKQNEVLAAISWKHSHELRRPLSNILGLTQMLLEHIDDDPLIKEETIVHLKSATHELDMLIREIIDQAGHTLESLMLSNDRNN